MKKQLPAILFGIACITLAVAFINSNKTVKQLQKEIAQLKTQLEIESSVPETVATLPDKPAEKAGENAVEQDAAIASGEDLLEESKSSGRRMMQNMAKMMDNPTMNKVMEASQRGAIGALYVDLIDDLNLNKEEMKYFMDMLTYRQMKQMDLGMKMISGSLSDEEKQALQDEMQQVQDTITDEMEKFLNNEEDFAEFEYYEKTMGERMMLSQMDKDLSGTGSELSDTAYRELLGIMHDERENFDFSSDLGDQKNTDMSPERFSQQNLQNYANDVQTLNDGICRKAEIILTPEQYEAFSSSLKSFTDMQLSQLEMAAQMFGGGE